MTQNRPKTVVFHIKILSKSVNNTNSVPINILDAWIIIIDGDDEDNNADADADDTDADADDRDE